MRVRRRIRFPPRGTISMLTLATMYIYVHTTQTHFNSSTTVLNFQQYTPRPSILYSSFSALYIHIFRLSLGNVEHKLFRYLHSTCILPAVLFLSSSSSSSVQWRTRNLLPDSTRCYFNDNQSKTIKCSYICIQRNSAKTYQYVTTFKVHIIQPR